MIEEKYYEVYYRYPKISDQAEKDVLVLRKSKESIEALINDRGIKLYWIDEIIPTINGSRRKRIFLNTFGCEKEGKKS